MFVATNTFVKFEGNKMDPHYEFLLKAMYEKPKKKKAAHGSAGRNYYGELKKFRGYRGPLKSNEENK